MRHISETPDRPYDKSVLIEAVTRDAVAVLVCHVDEPGGTGLMFLAVNQGLLTALGIRKKEDQVNFTDPTKSDYLAFKMGGVEGYVPGLHTEIRTLAKILATAFMSRKELRGESRQGKLAEIGGQYIMGKSTPAIQRGLEVGLGQDYRGWPVPWSSDQGTPNEPRLSWGEYLGSIGPIPLEGPIGYVYDHLKQSGASSMDATTITKGLIIAGLGATGLHVQEEHSQKPRGSGPLANAINSLRGP